MSRGSDAAIDGWGLEVVRGKDTGKVYALRGGGVTLGNALGGETGIDLADQEGTGPRRMAARQARIEGSGVALTIRDLDSPGGTFVNRQRLLSGQARALQPGDVIQLGGVQLKLVVRPAPGPKASTPAQPATTTAPPPVAPAAPPPPSGAPFTFTLAAGGVCRSWDDFLTVSAQRWAALRDELTSGRLDAFLHAIGRPELAPSRGAGASAPPDERLDAWLGRLPVTKPSQPELDVHPASLTIRAVGGAGATVRRLRITNTGYRLLRASVRVEPADASWVRVAPEFAGRPFVTVEAAEIPVEVELPETLAGPRTATLVIEGNGGTRRVPVVVEAPARSDPFADLDAEAVASGPGFDAIRGWVAGQSLPTRLALAGGIGLVLRLLVAFGDRWFGAAGAESSARLGLSGVGVVLAALGGLAGVLLALRRGGPRDLPACGFAGAFAGLLAGAVLVAACRAVEPLLGPWRGSTAAAVVLWTALGAGLGLLSMRLAPPRARESS